MSDAEQCLLGSHFIGAWNMYYAPETLPRAQTLPSALADLELRYERALEQADRWPGRPEAKARRISRLVASRDHEHAVVRDQIEELRREWFSGRASPPPWTISYHARAGD